MSSEENKQAPADPEEREVRQKRKAGMGRAWLLFGALFLGGVVLQHIMGGKAINGAGGERIPFVVAGLAAFILTMAAGWHAPWRRFLSSNRFSVPALFTLTILAVLGTLLLQGQPDQVLDVAYGSAANLIRGLFLDDLFHSIAFSLILGCGAGGLGLVLVRKRKLNLRYFGAVGAHLGLLLILAGAALGNVWVVKGRLNMHVGQKADAFAVPGADGRVMRHPLGFQISLDDFKLDMYEPDYRLMVFELAGDRETRIETVDPAEPAEWPRLSAHGVEVQAYWPDHQREQIVAPAKGEGPPNADAPSALGLETGSGDSRQTVWIFDDGSVGGGRAEIGGQRIRYFWDTERATAFLHGQADKGSPPTHVIVVGDKRIPVELGQTVPLPGGEQTLTVTQAFGDFIIDAQTKKPSNRSDKPNNPAVEVLIRDKAGKDVARKWLFAKFPAFAHEGQDSPLAALRYEFSGDGAAVGPDWIAIGKSGTWWRLAAGERAEEKTVAVGGTLALGKTAVRISQVLARAERAERDSSRSDKPLNPVVRLKVRGRVHDLKAKMPVRLTRNTVLVLASKGGETVRDYLSTVSIWEGDRKVSTSTVEVNYPLEYKGYVFYQSDYRPEDPTFSGFQVVRDSGLWLVYLGLFLNMLGVLISMFVPVFSARKKRQAGAEEGGTS